MTAKLLIASKNKGKLKEIQALLCDMPVEIVTPEDLSLDLFVEETGSTYAENAKLKAMTYAQAAEIITLSDDTGLEVAALDGQPGLHSSRFVPKENATDAERRSLLLKKLNGKPRPWYAQFVCVVAIATPNRELFYSKGSCPGEIISEERGSFGFGYDPLFLINPVNKTMAELTMTEKNRISHRAHAVRNSRAYLKKLFQIKT